MKKRSNTRPTDTAFRHHWISVAAYYKAESRRFEPGMELDDWIFAENEFVKMLITRYQIITLEDGGVTVLGLQRLAKSLKIEDAEEITQAVDLVHAIQKASNNATCFSFESEVHCNASENCLWKSECKKNKMMARW